MTVAPDHQQTCLQLLQDIHDVSTSLATRTYIWGGMVPDILRGEFLRPHHDVDGFTLNLLDVKTEMAERFSAKGYATTYLDEYDMLRIEKGDLHAALNRLEMDGDTAMWRHVGDQGTVYFPAVWQSGWTRPRALFVASRRTSLGRRSSMRSKPTSTCSARNGSCVTRTARRSRS